jgi:hypothetical protein
LIFHKGHGLGVVALRDFKANEFVFQAWLERAPITSCWNFEKNIA